MSVTVVVKPRAHLSLVSMHAGGPRRNGGLGFSLDGPTATVTIDQSDRFCLVDERHDTRIGETEAAALRERMEVVRREFSILHQVSIRITGQMLTHCGMGSGTAIRLACVEAAIALAGIKTTQPDLVRLAGRGGTSGIGIHTYFNGGFVYDLGVPQTNGRFAPSSASSNHAQPLLLRTSPMPDWPLGLCIPNSCKPKSQDEELEFFHRVTPLPIDASYEAAYHTIFGTLAAVTEHDYAAFCASITRIQSLRWKELERTEYGASLEAASLALTKMGADCVGMSSLGPMLYFFAPQRVLDQIHSRASDFDARTYIVRPSNLGRELRVH